MGKYYLAVDIGASSGRHILGHLENGKIKLEEIYRFENGMDHKDGKLLWNVDRLFGEILNGMKKCKELGKIPVSMAIDTWAVDYVLLDAQDRILGETYGYRDHRTDGMDAETAKILQETELYARTGIQKQVFNTVYQLMAVKQQTPELLQRAKTLLMLPDYFGFRLTGNKVYQRFHHTAGESQHFPVGYGSDPEAWLPGGHFPAFADARDKSGSAPARDPEGSWFQSGSGIVRKP